MPLSPGARIVTAPLPRTLDDAIADGRWLSRVRYLDLVAEIRMRGCRVPGCREHLRGGPRGREGSYCPLPPGKKWGGRAGRASSSMCRECREGQRGNS